MLSTSVIYRVFPLFLHLENGQSRASLFYEVNYPLAGRARTRDRLNAVTHRRDYSLWLN